MIAPALLIYQTLGLSAQDTQRTISMSLFISSMASIIRIKTWGPAGSGLLSIRDTSSNFVTPLIMSDTTLRTGGADVPIMMTALSDTLMLADCTEMAISHALHLARHTTTPLVSDVTVIITGLPLI